MAIMLPLSCAHNFSTPEWRDDLTSVIARVTIRLPPILP